VSERSLSYSPGVPPNQTLSRRAAPLPPEERRVTIVDAALPLVREHGRDVTTRQIAEAAGIAEGTIFRVFADKDAVIEAVIARAFDSADFARELRAIDLDQPLRDRVRSAVVVQRRRLEDLFQLMFALRLGAPPWKRADGRRSARRAVHHQPDVFDAMVAVLAAGADELRVSAAEGARRLRLVTFAATHPMITDHHPLSTDEIVDLLLYGIAAGTTSTPSAAAGIEDATC
jgi:AcrR family transcriptional regulator